MCERGHRLPEKERCRAKTLSGLCITCPIVSGRLLSTSNATWSLRSNLHSESRLQNPSLRHTTAMMALASHTCFTPRIACSQTPGRGRLVVVAGIARKDWKSVGAAVALGAAVCVSGPSLAELNKYEALAGGEFGNGTAQQYGEATLPGHDFHGEVSHLTPASMHAHAVQLQRRPAGCGYKHEVGCLLPRRTCAGPTSRQQTAGSATSRMPTCRGPVSGCMLCAVRESVE